MASLLKLVIFTLAWIAVALGTLVMGVAKLTHHWNRDQHRIIRQQVQDSHDLRNWRLK